jgi:hypothetical protein
VFSRVEQELMARMISEHLNQIQMMPQPTTQPKLRDEDSIEEDVSRGSVVDESFMSKNFGLHILSNTYPSILVSGTPFTLKFAPTLILQLLNI